MYINSKLQNGPESQTIHHRETSSVTKRQRQEKKQPSEGRAAEEISGDESDTLQLLFCNRIEINKNEKKKAL